MECKFVPRQKLVCIRRPDQWGVHSVDGADDTAPLPEYGKIYTCRHVVPIGPTIIVVVLEGFPDDVGYAHTGFRPLQDRPTEADTYIGVFAPALKVRVVDPVDAL